MFIMITEVYPDDAWYHKRSMILGKVLECDMAPTRMAHVTGWECDGAAVVGGEWFCMLSMEYTEMVAVDG